MIAKYYVTLSKSISKRTNFTKAVTDAYELCGGNEEDSKVMDIHNNVIDRKIYSDNTKVYKIFWTPVALSEPSNSRIKSIARDYVDKTSCFLRKYPKDGANREYSSTEIKAQIETENDNTVVYFEGTIAPNWIERTGAPIKDYSQCNLLQDTMDEEVITEEEALEFIIEKYNLSKNSVYEYLRNNNGGSQGCPRDSYRYIRHTPCSKNN